MADLIAVINHPDHPAWMRQVHGIGGCSHPVHLRGFTRIRDTRTGQLASSVESTEMPHGVMLLRCGNRRASVCASCAYIYRGDVYQLVRAGLGGGKGIPDSVADHPRVFATLTAPAFGAVHTVRALAGGREGPCHPRRTPGCAHGRATACFTRHTEDDVKVGTPLCADCYDYDGAVIWQASVGNLWRRFTMNLRRHLAKLTGRTVKEVIATVRVSYVKVVEYQRRGLVHIHAVIRADGIPPDDDENTVEDEGEAPILHPPKGVNAEPVGDGVVTAAAGLDTAGDEGEAPILHPPKWVNAELLADVVASAAAAVRLSVDGGAAGRWSLAWGTRLEVHNVTARGGEGDVGKVAAYVAKYASKGTEVTGWESWRGPENERGVHAQRMVTAAFRLAEVPELAGLKLGRWGKELGYGGHVSSKSRVYSTTLTALRQARADHQAAAGQKVTPDGVDLVVESRWELAGFGYTPGQALLAADVARDLDVNRVAAREAGAARPRAGGRDKLRRPDDARERGARVASWLPAPADGGDRHGN